MVADFDADGRADVLLVSSAQSSGSASDGVPSSVYYFDPSGLASSVELPGNFTASTGDLTGDGRADIALGGSPLFAYQSLATRGFSPILGPSHPVNSDTCLYSADLNGDGAREILVAHDTTLFKVNTSGMLTPLFALGVNAKLLTDISSAGYLQAAGEALAIFERAASRIHVYGSAATGTPELGLLSVVQVPIDPAVGDGIPESVVRVLFVDINADGRADLMALTDLGSAYVAFGVGDGSFNSVPPPPALAGGDDQAMPYSVAGQDRIATAWQVTDDAQVSYFPLIPASSMTALQQALAVDLTGDGLTDVAAVALEPIGMPNLDLFRGARSGGFNHLAIATNGSPQLRGIGDFNGDDHPDLLITEGVVPGAEQTTISVLFSPVVPNNARVQDQIAIRRIQGAVAGYLDDELGNSDQVGDVAALHRDASNTLQLALLEGGVDGLLHSSLTPHHGARVFEASAIGHFRASQPLAQRDLAVIAGPGSGTSSLELFSIDEGRSISVGRTMFAGFGDPIRAITADLDLDGLDEIYELDGANTLTQLKVSDDSGTPLTVSQTPQPIGGSVLAIASSDVNSDGIPDLSLTGDATVWVLMADQRRHKPALHTFQVPSEHCVSMVAHAWVQADGDSARELALLCNQGRADNSKSLSLFKANLATDELIFVNSQPAPASNALAAGDFNGDGVEDLLSSDGELALLLGRPR